MFLVCNQFQDLYCDLTRSSFLEETNFEIFRKCDLVMMVDVSSGLSGMVLTFREGRVFLLLFYN